VARTCIVSILKGLQCSSELPSIDDIYHQFREIESRRKASGTPDEHLHRKRLEVSIVLAHQFFTNFGIATGRPLFKTVKVFQVWWPASCQQNGQIWLIKNCHVPLILRPTGTGTFVVVVECYLHGFMHGEMLEDRWGLKDKISPVILV
jgi:hypothetical protein